MRVSKKTFTRPIPPNATIVTKRGIRYAKWSSRGRSNKAPLTSDGTKIREESSKYYGTVHGKLIPLSSDKSAAEMMLRQLLASADLESIGIKPERESGTIAERIEQYERHLQAKGNTAAYVALTIGRVKKVCLSCGFVRTSDIRADRFSAWLTRERQDKPINMPDGQEFTPAFVAKWLGVSEQNRISMMRRHRLESTGRSRATRIPRATLQRLVELQSRGISVETANHYIRAMRGFIAWMLNSGHLEVNPLRTVSLLNADVDARRMRRQLSLDELQSLFTAAKNSGRSFRGLDGHARYVLYLLACATGLRAEALASLTPEHFTFGTQSYVTLAARNNKSRKTKVQPMPDDVAGVVEEYVRGRMRSERLWPGTWASGHRAAEMLRGDLAVAGIDYAVSSPDGPKYADFHALRHTYLTLGGLSGIDLLTLQKLAGHSKPELTARYSHRTLNDLSEAVNKLPRLSSE